MSQKLLVADVYANPDQPRQVFEPAAVHELAASIRRTGLLQPITVRPDGAGKFMIVAGERRFRAHQLAGLTTIDCNVVEITDAQLAIGAIVENLQRVDISQLEEARAFGRQVAAGHTAESLAEELGVPLWRVANRLQLLSLSADHLDLFAKGVLSPRQALELAKLPADLRPALFRAISSGQANSDAKLRALAFELVAAASQSTMFGEAPKPTKQETEVLSRFERLIDRLTAACNEGIRDNEVVILKKVDPNRASTVLQQMALIRADLARMEKSLMHSAAQGALLDQAAA